MLKEEEKSAANYCEDRRTRGRRRFHRLRNSQGRRRIDDDYRSSSRFSLVVSFCKVQCDCFVCMCKREERENHERSAGLFFALLPLLLSIHENSTNNHQQATITKSQIKSQIDNPIHNKHEQSCKKTAEHTSSTMRPRSIRRLIRISVAIRAAKRFFAEFLLWWHGWRRLFCSAGEYSLYSLFD